jgi:hypothetical protein
MLGCHLVRSPTTVLVLVPAAVLVAIAIPAVLRFRARRRLARLNISGGRKALVLYLAERGR